MFDRIVHELARLFRGLHWIVGITTISSDASPKEERLFVLLWSGIIVALILFFPLLFLVLRVLR